jgi:integral membrane protein
VSAGTPVDDGSRSDAMSSIDDLRRVGKLEGVSFLVLLGIAMPLKYAAGLPLAVKLCGWIHGLLFVWFVISLWLAKREAGLSTRQVITAFIAALLPFGPFLIDRRLEQWRGSAPR